MNRVKNDVARNREDLAWRLRTQQYLTHQEIAEKIGVDRSSVTKMLQRVRNRVLSGMEELVQDEIAQQLDMLDTLLSQAYKAWEASRNPAKAVEKRVARRPADEGDTGATSMADVAETLITEVTERDGDKTWQELILRILAERRKILGADAPQKTDVTLHGQNGGPLEVKSGQLDVNALTVEQAEKLLGVITTFRAGVAPAEKAGS
jgi:transcriptional regulator with XRE-family HTH domain